MRTRPGLSNGEITSVCFRIKTFCQFLLRRSHDSFQRENTRKQRHRASQSEERVIVDTDGVEKGEESTQVD